MTQIDHETVSRAPAEAGWRDLGIWLIGKRITICAFVLVAGQASLNGYVLSRGFFQQDDFAIGGLAAHAFTLHLLFQNYAGHLIPGVFALAWLLTHTGGGYDWGLWAGTLVGLQALTGLALLRALRTLFGNRMIVLLPLGVFLFTPMAMTDLSWWSVGMLSVPIQLALALAVDQHVRYVRTGRLRNAVFATAWIVFGLAFFEKSVAIPLLLFALTSAFGVPGGWGPAMLGTLRRYWRAWLLYAAAIIAEIVVYTTSLQASPVKVKVPAANTTVAFGWDLLRDTFVPAALGGPWHWTLPLGAPRSWALYAFAAVPTVLADLSWVFAAVVVVVSLWYRRHAGRAWIILLGWLLLADIGPVVLGRVAVFGTIAAAQSMYVSDAAPVLAICLALAFLPLRGEDDAYRNRLPLAWRRGWRGGWRGAVALAGATVVAAAFMTGSVWSAGAYRGELHPANSRSYLQTASAALSGVSPDAAIYPTQIPGQLAWTLFGQLTDVQNALAPLADEVTGQAFRWSSAPAGSNADFLIFDQQGRLHPAVVIGPSSYPFRKASQCVLTPAGMQLQLTANVYPFPFILRVGYYAARPVTLALTFGGHQYQLSLPASSLAYAYLPVQGPGNTVGITSVTPDPQICIGTVTIGNVEPSPTAAPTPLFPLPG